jgi:hypothetical protein
MPDNDKSPVASNFCVGFVDLLGQRQEFKGEGLLPVHCTPEEKQRFDEKLKRTIGHIKTLDCLIDRTLKSTDLQMRKLVPEQNAGPPPKIQIQRWSDGLVLFINFAERSDKRLADGIFRMFLCLKWVFMGCLVKKMPIRGAIDIGWGVELHENELYGAAIANAYELESKIAQYPSIVIGGRTIEYLKINILNKSSDAISLCNNRFSTLCWNMLVQMSMAITACIILNLMI